MTDLLSGWTAGKGILEKNAELTVRAVKELKVTLPMSITALFFDNGIEYVNHLLVQELKDAQGVDVARGHAGKSNDQCHIEQKNNTFVRQIFGHVRIEDLSLIPLMNEIYEIWGNLHNYFMPQMKLIEKDKVNGKVRKRYDKPKTPFQRLMECETFSEEKKRSSEESRQHLIPLYCRLSFKKN